jgi:hypothetical protein
MMLAVVCAFAFSALRLRLGCRLAAEKALQPAEEADGL